MSHALFAAISGALGQEIRMDVLSNNLANINSVGFKQESVSFQSYLPGRTDPSRSFSVNGPVNSYSRAEATVTDFSVGPMKLTGSSFDLALDGKGFFCIKTPEGIRYTRKGNFSLNREGTLVTQEGLPVLGAGGAIKIDGKDVRINRDGGIAVDGNQVDTLKIVDFDEPGSLERVGNTMFAPADPSFTGSQVEEAQVMQGFLELSNVNASETMIEIIDTLRTYESYQKVIQFVDECTEKAINDVGRFA